MPHEPFTHDPRDPGFGDYLMHEQYRRSVETTKPQPTSDGCFLAPVFLIIGAFATVIGGILLILGLLPGYSLLLAFGGVVLFIIGAIMMTSDASE